MTFILNRAVYEIMWKNIVERDRPHVTIRRMYISWWIPKATNTHPQHVIHIAFPLSNGCPNEPQCYVIRTLPVLFGFHNAVDLYTVTTLP